jgi:peptidyl-tRNA hydrolase
MIIVNDIQDAMMMRKKLMSIVRRSHNFGHSRATVLIELLNIVDDLQQNIERMEAEMEIQDDLWRTEIKMEELDNAA